MCVSMRSDLFKNVFLVLNIYFFFIFASENDLIVITSSEDDMNKYEQEFPLDLSIKNKNNPIPLNSFTISNKSTNINNQSDISISDFFINSTFFDTNEYKNCENTFEITYRHLKFFFTKENIYDFAAAETDKNVDKCYFIYLKQILMETKYLLLNIKNDIIETMTAIYPSTHMTIYNTEHLRSINDIEIYQDYWINSIKMSPIHIKQDFKTSSNLEEFIRISYDNFIGSSFCLSTNKLSRYINANFKSFSLKGLLDTLIVASYKSKQMQSDLRSIIFCILFFYKHADNNRILTMEFILKDIMIRTILLVKLFELNEDDDLKNEQKKQELPNKIEKEIFRSFLSAFHTRDLKKMGNNIESVRDEIFMSVVGAKFDCSFIVFLSKVFKSMHYLKAILHDPKHDSLNQLREELRSSCKKMFEFKESFFDMIKLV